MNPPDSHFAPIADLLSRIDLASRQTHELLTIWPLLAREGSPGSGAPAYVALADGMEAGALHVSEVPGGRVPHVAVENRSESAILVLFGEELRGALQNRVANASFLVPPKQRVVLDVSCVEAGRWSRRSLRFFPSREILASRIRKKMALTIARARASGAARFAADQGEVWDDVAERIRVSRTQSETGAYADHVSSRQPDLAEASKAFHLLPEQIGFVAAFGGEIVGLEIVGRPEVFARVFDGLVRSYLIDSIDSGSLETSVPVLRGFDAPEPFLEALSAAPTRRGASLGLGEDLRVQGSGVEGCALVAGDVLHLTAFPSEGA